MPRDRYFGKAGDFAVMSEFLLRGYNVAVPEVDVGNDIFVIQDSEGDVWRVQVKTATAQRTKDGFRGRFRIPLRQLDDAVPPEMVFAFALRVDVGQWDFLLIPRRFLRTEHDAQSFGSTSRGELELTFHFKADEVTCTGRNLQSFRGTFNLPRNASPP
jgi:hypothetical protein